MQSGKDGPTCTRFIAVRLWGAGQAVKEVMEVRG
jgi:hypothetical protein